MSKKYFNSIYKNKKLFYLFLAWISSLIIIVATLVTSYVIGIPENNNLKRADTFINAYNPSLKYLKQEQTNNSDGSIFKFYNQYLSKLYVDEIDIIDFNKSVDVYNSWSYSELLSFKDDLSNLSYSPTNDQGKDDLLSNLVYSIKEVDFGTYASQSKYIVGVVSSVLLGVDILWMVIYALDYKKRNNDNNNSNKVE